jgi:hypothetical protein
MTFDHLFREFSQQAYNTLTHFDRVILIFLCSPTVFVARCTLAKSIKHGRKDKWRIRCKLRIESGRY